MDIAALISFSHEREEPIDLFPGDYLAQPHRADLLYRDHDLLLGVDNTKGIEDLLESTYTPRLDPRDLRHPLRRVNR